MKDFFSHYADFKGFSNRKDFWISILVITFGIPLLIAILMLISRKMIFLLPFAYLAIFIPTLAISARRLHDVGYSAWCMFIPFYRIYLWCLPGVENKGANPQNNTAKTIGIILLALSALGIPVCGGITAAVAIPSYMKYVEESKKAIERDLDKEAADFKAAMEIYQKEMAALEAAQNADSASDALSDK